MEILSHINPRKEVNRQSARLHYVETQSENGLKGEIIMGTVFVATDADVTKPIASGNLDLLIKATDKQGLAILKVEEEGGNVSVSLIQRGKFKIGVAVEEKVVSRLGPVVRGTKTLDQIPSIAILRRRTVSTRAAPKRQAVLA